MTTTLPPYSMAGAVNLGTFGTINASTHLYPSIFIPGQLLFDMAPLDKIWWKFTLARQGQTVALVPTNETPDASSFFTLMNSSGQYLVDNRDTDPTGPPIFYSAANGSAPATYYFTAEHADSAFQVEYSFGLFAYDRNWPDPAGNTAATAFSLGTLNASTSISRSDHLNTTFERVDPGSAGGPMKVDYNHYLQKDQIDYFYFNVTAAGQYKFTSSGTVGAFVLHGPPTQLGPESLFSISNGSTVRLEPGKYYLEVFDSATSVLAGGNGLVTIRKPWETADAYDFKLTYAGGGLADFTATTTAISRNVLFSGEGFTLSYKIGNLGVPSASSNGFYLSKDAVITKADTLLMTSSLLTSIPTNGALSLSVPLKIPNGLAAGTYYIGVIADYSNFSHESNELNNASSGIKITVSGPKLIDGRPTVDNLVGTAADDLLRGFGSGDTLSGLDGYDVLIGGAGADILTGGTGADTFRFTSLADMGKTQATRDIIKDFIHSNTLALSDRIDLSLIDANGSLTGDKFIWIGNGNFTGVSGQLHYFQQAGVRTIVEGDINGDRIADFQIELTGLKSLVALDFVL